MIDATAYHKLGASILAYELALLNDDGSPAVAVERACQQFYRRLSPLVTPAGSQAFLSRSLHLAGAEFPFLNDVQAGPTAEECLQGLDPALHDIEETTTTSAFISVLSYMIGLLVVFIGHDLTMHAIRDVWPDAGTSHPEEGDMT